MRLLIAAALCFFVPLAYASGKLGDNAFSFKGAVFGADVSEYKNRPEFKCEEPERMRGMGWWFCDREDDTIAGAAAHISLNFIDNKLDEINVTFSRGEFDEVVDALISKFGQPITNSHEKGKERDGDARIKDLLSWFNRHGEMMIATRYGGVLPGKSKVFMQSKGLVDTGTKGRMEAAKRRAADL